jgi:hypothetical protein
MIVAKSSTGKVSDMAQKLSGGGIGSNKLVRPSARTGPASTNKINPRGVSQYGYATGSRLSGTGSYTIENSALPVRAGTAKQEPLGNTIALNVKGGGPGAGRTVMRAGSQGRHGEPVQGSSPGRRDILSEYGRETTGASTVRRR